VAEGVGGHGKGFHPPAFLALVAMQLAMVLLVETVMRP
jgi:hypothetical protein